MYNTFTSIRKFLIFICIALYIFFFSACKNTQYVVKGKEIKWINWEVTFKNDIDKIAREKTFLLIEKYVIEKYFAAEPKNLLVHLSFRIVRSSFGLANSYGFSVSYGPGDASQTGFSTVKPPQPGPRQELFPNVANIRPILIGNQLGEFPDIAH
ncbi:MAG: hypothetical protein ABIU77_13700 [Ferruginibacter sp.]